ncbi:hypothetical protein E1B28_004617 [Marasmius oreades]|nr:uncharacterized protein E1B28_004617 [Marasmius oreades]KAG7097250.1 hypothetical protein E1B28_004617 [Marasmius oreades]
MLLHIDQPTNPHFPLFPLGIHSTAGPLPPPPRASFMFGPTAAPPPRPPRQVRSPSPTKSPTIASSSSPTKGAPSASTSRSGDRGRSPRSQTKEVMMEALKLPPEVTAALSSRLAPVTKAKSNGSLGRTPSGADETSLNNRSDDDNNSNLAPTSTSTEPPPEIASVHTREGAFAPSHIVSPATTTTSSTTTPTLSRTSDMTVQVYPTTTLHTLPERIKVASSSSYEEYTLREEDEGSDYDTCEQKDARHHEQENVDISQPVIKPPPRGQSLAVFNATGIGGLPASSAEDDEWILADTFGGGGGGGGGAKKSLEVEGMPTTPKTLRREKAPKRHSFESHASSNESEGPSPPPKTFRTSFTKGLKRLSLNASPRRSASVSSGHSRTPSQNSSTLPALPDEANHDGRRSFSPSPSPQFDPRPLSPLNPNATSPPSNPPSKDPSPNPYASYNTRPHPLTHKRIKNSSPDALFCSELYSVPKKSTTSAERCAIYARKLNELYLYDCGLGDWVASVSIGISRGPAAHDVSMISFTDTPRKTSHGSTISEATFPRRPDASTATDLMIPTMISSSSSMSPVSSAPRLPYPSLAIKSTSNEKGGLLGHLATPTSSRGTGGFFASLGRKASINRHRGGSSDSGHGGGKARLTKPPPHSASINGNTISSPVLVDTSQSIPGGPRALPGRAKTLMLSPSPSSSKGFDAGSGSESGSGTVGRRPSMYNLSSSSVSDSSHRLAGSERRDKEREDDPAFASQVNRLADLLPHVEKTVLAGYLRRAGQDILAIGQYLDDEKNGCVRRE